MKRGEWKGVGGCGANWLLQKRLPSKNPALLGLKRLEVLKIKRFKKDLNKLKVKKRSILVALFIDKTFSFSLDYKEKNTWGQPYSVVV